ncbi:MAG: hypothetical protein EOS18_00075 [Mesorhizobium sp.]|nr:MAG: hypothetical protein EOS18_00075 [Mesorhizobium sp.]
MRLTAWLRTDSNRPRTQKRTIKQLHADLTSLGYEGSYGRIAVFRMTGKKTGSASCNELALQLGPTG